MSSANRRRTSVIGALPGRKPGMRAMRAISRATFSATLLTFSAGISSSISRLQVISSVIWKSLSGANVPQASGFYPSFNYSESGKEECRNERQRSPQQKIEYRESVCARQPRSRTADRLGLNCPFTEWRCNRVTNDSVVDHRFSSVPSSSFYRIVQIHGALVNVIESG